MTLDADLLRAAREQRDRLRGLRHEVGRVTDAFHRQVRLLHEAGGSPWEIADRLGLPDEQVRTILGTGTANYPGAAAGNGPRPAGDPVGSDHPGGGSGHPEGGSGHPEGGSGHPEGGRSVPQGGSPAAAGTGGQAGGVVGRGLLRRSLACSFCGSGKDQGSRLVAGLGVAVCDRCVRLALEVVVEGAGREPEFRLVDGGDPEQAWTCSFCRKPLRRVGRLVRGRDGIHVCGECLDLCTEILRDEAR